MDGRRTGLDGIVLRFSRNRTEVADILPPKYPEVSYNSHPRWHVSRVRPRDERVEVDGTSTDSISRLRHIPATIPSGQPAGCALQHT
jgi:hypothetical protein